MRRKVHYIVEPQHLWSSIAHLARTQSDKLLNTLQAGFKYIETESFESTFQGLFSEIDLGSPKLGACRAWGASTANRPQRAISHRLFAP